MNGDSDIRTESESFVHYYRANGLGFGSVDIVCGGPTGTEERIALLVRILLDLPEPGRSPISRFVIVVPAGDEDVAEGGFTIGIEAALRAAGEPRDLLPSSARDRIQLAKPADLQADSLLALIRDAEPRSVIIVREAAEYRTEGVRTYETPEKTGATAMEDFWVPHLHALSKAVLAAVKDKEALVILDAGKLSPQRAELQELLQSVDGCGVIATISGSDLDAILAAHTAEWEMCLSTGRLGAVLKDIDDLPSALNAEKPFLRAQVLQRAGLHDRALAAIQSELPLVDNPNPFALVKLARIAEDAGSSVLAAKLLRSGMNGLHSREGLELALSTASDINNAELEKIVVARLEALFPRSAMLSRRRAAAFAFARDYRKAADTLADVPGSEELSALYSRLGNLLERQAVPNYIAALEQIAAVRPKQLSRALAISVQDALGRGLLVHAMMLSSSVDAAFDMTRQTAALFLNVIERSLLSRTASGDIAVGLDDLKRVVTNIVKHLSNNPNDRHIRFRLAHLLSVEVSGSIGLSLIAAAALDLNERRVLLRGRETSGGYSPEELLERRSFIEASFAWLAAESPVVPGRTTLPRELLTEPPEEIVPAITRVLDLIGKSLDSDDDVDALMRWLTLGIAIVPHTSNPDQDIEMVKSVAGRLILAGRVQSARDLAEHVLQQADLSTRRARLAWLAIADIYHRLGNSLESFIALASGFATACDVDAEQALNENTLLVRLLRDTHLWHLAWEVLRTTHDLVKSVGLDKRYTVRLGTLELQLRMTEYAWNPARPQEELPEFLRALLLNCGAVLDTGDDPAPTAVMLAQTLRMAAEAGISPETGAAETLRALLDTADPITRSLVSIMSSDHPTAEGVLALFNRLEAARYSEDVGYDVRSVAQLARRLLAGKEASSNAEVAAFAIELLADRAVATPGGESAAAPPSATITTAGPSTLAKELSLGGVSVVMAGLDSDWQLVRLAATAGRIGDVVREEESVFSSARLRSWAKEFPYRYGVDETTVNIFYTSTEGIGFSDLPGGRVVLVTDAELQQIPPNLLLVGRDLAGRSRPMAAAPSLSWLAAACKRAGGGNRKLSAWISSVEKLGSTLAMIADRLGPTFEKYGFDVDRGPALPERMGGSDVAVVAAHGSVMPKDRYFQLVADEGELRVVASDLARTLRNVAVVILFVCSGGRMDKHPSSSTIVGLAKQLLDRGCSAVVASPWPLDSRVPYHWLPEFLRVWAEGGMLIDANFAANKSVAAGLGEDPARCLAMSVYGDPFRGKPQ